MKVLTKLPLSLLVQQFSWLFGFPHFEYCESRNAGGPFVHAFFGYDHRGLLRELAITSQSRKMSRIREELCVNKKKSRRGMLEEAIYRIVS